MNDVDGYRLTTIAAYAGASHGKLVLRAMAVLGHLHRPADPHKALLCPTCRTSRGRHAPWPCPTFVEMSRALGFNTDKTLNLANLAGIKLPPPLDIDQLEHNQRLKASAAPTRGILDP
ncbi:hypothetical protein ACFWYW_46835 [Nonomuraea sp. NPDC059023]|uniref:hypothetical protein n=1 Tax=unclassified Nonomuraea TaxID=2593643 RepID=UPI0036B0060A